MGFPGRAPPLARKDTVRGWKGEPIGGAGWPPQPALGAAYTDTRRFGAEVPTASPVHKHLLTSSGGRSRLGAETACSMAGWPRAETPRRDPAPHGPALCAETPRPTARRFHSLQTQQPFPVPDRISGPESPRASSSAASLFTEAGEYV